MVAERRAPSIAAYSPNMSPGAQIGKCHCLPFDRIDANPDLARSNKKHVVRGIEVIDDRLTRLVGPPTAALLNARERVRREA